MKLYQALKTVITADSGNFRQLVFHELADRKFSIKITLFIYYRSPNLIKAFLILLYGLKSYFLSPECHSRNPILALYEYKNELRQFKFLEEIYGSKIFDFLKPGPTHFLSNIRGIKFLFCFRFLRFAYKLSKKYDFLVCCRVMSTFFYYIKFKEVFEKKSYKSVLVSSDRNPYAMGLIYAAKQYSLKTLFITHGHLPESPPKLSFDFSFLDGPALKSVYERSGVINGEVIFKGCEGKYRPLDLTGLKKKAPVIGIFQSLLTDSSSFIKLIKETQIFFSPSKIIVRLHPNEIIRNKNIIQQIRVIPSVDISLANQLATHDLKQCDFIISGNSSVHLTSLTYGVPSVYIKGIDIVPHDFYLFVELKIIPYFESTDKVSLESITNFYQGNWNERFRFFNASYGKKDDNISKTIKNILGKIII